MVESELQRLASWQQEPATASSVEAALAAIWQEAFHRRSAMSDAPISASCGIVRTCVANFLVYTSSRGVCERAASAIAHLGGTHPTRSLLLLAQPEAPNSEVGASIEAYCHTAKGGPCLCFEQLQLTARGAAASRLPGIATRLLIHDLPTLLWWPGDPPLEAPAFAAMSSIADIVIVDSSEFEAPAAGLRSLADLARGIGGRARIADLNWDRLIDWRELAAQFFDAVTLRPHLDHIADVEIQFAAGSSAKTASAHAILFAGWLASRLGWQLEHVSSGTDGSRLTARRGGEEIPLRLVPVAASAQRTGAITSLRLESRFAGHNGNFTLQAADDGEHGTATVIVDDGGPVTRGFVLPRPSESALLSEEIEAVGHERAFDEALQAAGQLTTQIPA